MWTLRFTRYRKDVKSEELQRVRRCAYLEKKVDFIGSVGNDDARK